MAIAKHSSTNQSSAREFNRRVLTCLNKLSDRDTPSAAASKLESIAKTLNHDSISSFLSSISATDASDKSPARRQYVRLISTLSEAHGDASHVTKPPFMSIAKPLVDALVTEQDLNSQIGAALCFALAVDCAPDPEPVYLRRMLPRIESEDWSARKSAADALEKLAVVKADLLSEFKAPCLKTFEAKKFDKIL